MEREIRPLLRDYVEILLYTGMRHGTEAIGLCWNHISWHTHEGKKYLRLWVDGKTGGRWLIAKHEARAALERLQQRQSRLSGMSFDELLSSRVKDPVFVTSSGYQPHRIDGTFRRLLRDSGLEPMSMLGAFEVAVEILVRTDHQQLQRVLIQDAVGEQAQQVAHAELIDLHAGQITDLGLTDVGLAGDGSHRFVKRGFLLLVQLFNRALEGRGDKDAHQPNWYSPTGSSWSAIRMSRMTLKGRSGFSVAILPI